MSRVQQFVLALVGITFVAVVVLAFEVVLLLFAGVVLGVFLTRASGWVAARSRVPRRAAVLGLLVAALGLGVLAGVFLLPAVVEQGNNFVERLPQYSRNLEGRLRGSHLGAQALAAADASVQQLFSGDVLPGALQQGSRLVGQLAGVFSSALGAVGGLVVLLAVAVYIAFEPDLYRRGLMLLVPAPARPRAALLFERLGRVLTWWVIGQSLSMLVLGTIMSLGLWILGIRFPLLLGLFTALMTFVPSLGPVIAAIPTLLVALTHGYDATFYTFLLVLVVQNVEGLILTPTVHRRIIALPPALVMAALLVLGTLGGVAGVLVAMPLVATLMTITQVLLGDDPETDPAASPPAGG